MKLFAHQEQSVKFLAKNKRVFDMSDPGTGKTGVQITAFVNHKKKKPRARALVIAPKSLLKAAWFNDIKKFAPHLKVSIAWAHCRKEALEADADVYVINFDGVNDLSKLPARWWTGKGFDTLIIDESTAFKHHTSGRSRALAKLVKYFDTRRLMSGTPTSNGIVDIWHQVFLLDGGKRLGPFFTGFRNAVSVPIQKNGRVEWVERENMEAAVGTLIADIVIRHKFEDCVDIPENHRYAVTCTLSDAHREKYEEFKRDAILLLNEGDVVAEHAAVVATKLLQIASGAVYGNGEKYSRIATERYELVTDLVEERQHSIVFYHWKHQLEELVAQAKKRGFNYVVWNPDKPEIEQQFQQGFYKTMFAHPQSAGHGLTLTRATATIWASPTYNLEHFLQGLKRVHRIGQDKKTETIVIVAEDTLDEDVWKVLQKKDARMTDLLNMMKELRK